MAQIKIVQISDTHLAPAGVKPANYQQLDPEEKLRRVFDDVYKTAVKPDLVVIGGDLVHDGDAPSYAEFRHLLDQEQERLMAPIKVILGNHDRTDQFYRGFLNERHIAERYYYQVSGDDWDFYFLDTKCGQLEQGYLDQNQLQWLHDKLQRTDKAAAIFMHHPLYGLSLSQMKYSILQNGGALLDAIEGTNVKAIFSGHVHYANTYLTRGILNVVADSTAYHINCTDPREHFVYDGTSYNVITIDGQNIGVEQRPLYLGTNVINTFRIPDTDFVDPMILKRELNRVRDSLK